MISTTKDKTKKFIFSIFPLKIIMFLLAVGPLIGVYISYSQEKYLLGLVADEKLLFNFSLYVVILGIFLLTIKNNICVKYRIYSKNKLNKITKRLLILAIICFVSILLFAGIHTLSGSLGRGEVRINAGILGPIYALCLKYILPILSLLASIILYQQGKRKNSIYIYLIILVSGFMTGGKAITILILLSTVCYFWIKITFLKKLISISVAVAIIISSHMFFTKRELTLSDSLQYNLVRGTQIAAYGVLASWDYSKQHDIQKLPTIIRSIFGNKISIAIFNSNENSSAIEWDIAKLITYTYYPSWEKALEGSTNLTRTIFSDFILYFSDYWLIAFIFFLLLISFLFRKMISLYGKGAIASGSLLFVFLNMTILPVINSGGLFRIISIPTLAYYLILFLLTRYYILK